MSFTLDLKRFWEVNQNCLDLRREIPRVPVNLRFDGDWICELLKLDNARYYTDFTYQQENRLKCSTITEKELGYPLYPAVDFGVVLDASVYGGEVNYHKNAAPVLGPVVTEPGQIKDLVARMEKKDPLAGGLVPKYLEWRERIKAKYGIDLYAGQGMKGCAAVLGQLCGVGNFLTWLRTNPEEIKALVECWFETSVRYIRGLRAATGTAVVSGGFALASDLTGLLSPGLYREFIFEAEKRLFTVFATGENDRRYYHSDYHMSHHLDSLRELGVNHVNIDPYITAVQILKKMPGVIVHGQIPPTTVLLYGSPEEVEACVQRDISQAGPGRQLILTTVGGINPGTSFRNLRALCYAVEKYGYIYG